MTVTIDGTNGITSPDFEPSSSTTPTNGLFLPTTNTIAWATNSTERLRLDASGNLGLGVTPSAWATISALQVKNASLGGYANNLYLNANAFYDGSWKYISTGYATSIQSGTGAFSWFIAPSGTAGAAISFTQAMTLDASGNLAVGTTSTANGRLTVQAGTSASGYSAFFNNLDGTYNPYLQIQHSSGGLKLYVSSSAGGSASTLTCVAVSGGVYLSGGATSWAAVSDEREKDIIEPIENAVFKVGTLRAAIGKYKNDTDGVRRSFLIAQDVQSVFPEAVDAEDPERLGVRYTDTIPLLVAAIKELTQRLEKLENQNG